jgi:hypothetical protein
LNWPYIQHDKYQTFGDARGNIPGAEEQEKDSKLQTRSQKCFQPASVTASASLQSRQSRQPSRDRQSRQRAVAPVESEHGLQTRNRRQVDEDQGAAGNS